MFKTAIFLLNFCLMLTHGHYIKFNPEKKAKTLPEKPIWPSKYYVDGTLKLPYAEINEPFTAWYDGDAKKSRIDYYGGISQTIQRGDVGDFGTHYMISPMSNEVVMNQLNCFSLAGDSDGPVLPQQLLPNMDNFTYIGDTVYLSVTVNVWELKQLQGTKLNTYTVYVMADSKVPVYYRMMGYNTLLGSHYDEYVLTYNLMATSFPDDVFETPMKDMKCHGFPGPGYEARIVSNPMAEFIHPVDQDHLEPMYTDFINKFTKNHEDERMHNFNHNLRFINSMNRQKLSFKLKINHFADFTANEMRKLRGRSTPKSSSNIKVKSNALPFVKTMKPEDLPKEWNWRLFGAVTPVKDQATCGSCWSFGTTGTIEGALFLKTGFLVRLSQQNLMDCSWGFGNNGCDGGEEFRSYEYIMKHGGIATEASYGDYLAVDGFCHQDKAKIGAKIASYVNVTSGDMDALKMAIAQRGPLAVGIDAAHPAFVFYSHGVYYNPKCGNTPDDLDHAVLAVGYGTQHGQPYTLIKNSWSTHWGNDGYVLMSQVDNNCGVATDATFVNLK